MKKEILALIDDSGADNVEERKLSLNPFLTLSYFKINGYGARLNAEIKIGVMICGIREIVSRDYDGIVVELTAFQSECFRNIADHYNNQLKGGYID